jgi:transcription elongation GreA/GreB family factor
MSRAFVKEPDGDAVDAALPDRPLSEHPLYVTPRGLKQMHGDVMRLRTERDRLSAAEEDIGARAQLRQVERDLRYAETCAQNAIVVAPPPHRDEVRFGARVELLDEDGNAHRFVIVGEHEACAPTGLISWVSPLARSLIGRRVGDTVIWERPAGNAELEVAAIDYPELG